MGACIYCRKPARLLRNQHPECKERERQRELRAQVDRQRIVSDVTLALKAAESFDGLEEKLAKIEEDFSVLRSDRKALLIQAWENSVKQSLEDGVLEVAEEARLAEFQGHFALSQRELDRNGRLTQIAKARVLRDLLSGIVPHYISLDGQISINIQKGEQIVWAFSGSQYLEDKTRREFVGRSQGVSLRIMKGVYYRVGAFKGRPVEHSERVHIDTGWVILTNKNLYFAGPKKSMRIPYAKMVSFESFSNGIGLMRDAATAKPQFFLTGDGWFTYNVVANLSQI